MKESPTINIVRYEPSLKDSWNNFVAHSRNGTFLLRREFMDYHAHRFNDHSLLFYKGAELVALLPAERSESALWSHRGLTYGGLLLAPKTTAATTLQIVSALIDYLRADTTIEKFVFSPVPAFYATYPCEEERYAFFRHGAVRTQCKLSSVIPLAERYPYANLRRRKIRSFEKSGLQIVEDERFDLFWAVLTENLQQRHHTKPVHTVEEITLLHRRFPEHIRLHRVTNNAGQTIAGAVMFETTTTAHVQYIASTEEGRNSGALDGLFDHLIGARYAHKHYFDFGISVEQGGWVLNEGLIHQKEGFGARGAVYETYEITIQR